MANNYAIYKPYGMLSRFSREGDRPTLAELGRFEKSVYPVGRLDADSEGLLILTDDKRLNAALLHPIRAHRRIYYAQVEGKPDEGAVDRLRHGVDIRIKGKTHRTAPAEAHLMNPPALPDRHPPIRYRKNVPTTWIQLALTEGKNRQVRRMTAAVGFPTLRLVRYAIEDLTIEGMAAGAVRKLSDEDLRIALKL